MKWLERDSQKRINEWFKTPSRSPLVIFGPRQVGKTALASYFANENFSKNTFTINFYKDSLDKKKPRRFARIFESTGDPREILKELGVLLDKEIDPGKSIILMDEIQECPRAYESLKLFKDEFPGLPIIATGSYMRLFLENNTEIRHPVGCTEEILLGPLSFSEFLRSYSSVLYKQYLSIDISEEKTISINLHEKFLEALELYFFTGGMPEVIFNFLNLKDEDLPGAIRVTERKKNDLFKKYYADLEKYSKSTDIKKIKRIFEEIPFYLEKYNEDSVERLQINSIKKGARFKELKSAFDYLKYSGLIIQSHIVKDPKLPFKVGVDDNKKSHFKCYFFDVGILNSKLGVGYKTLSSVDMGHYKGYIAENYVAQQIKKYSEVDELYCYKKDSNKDSAEVEFIIEKESKVIPIEVKSSLKSKKSKSLDSYIKKFKPKTAVKCSPSPNISSERFLQMPIYLIEKFLEKDSLIGNH